MTSSNTRSGLIPYQKSLSQLLEKFEEVTFFHLSREKKKFADALPTLASMTKIDCGVDLQPLQIEARDSPAYCLNIEEEPDERPWYHDIKQYIKTREYPPGATEKENNSEAIHGVLP
jgi:hypothetical protein